MTKEDEINNLAEAVASDYGPYTATTHMSEERDVKVKWCRGPGSVVIFIPDYLEDAPLYVIETMLRGVMDNVVGGCRPAITKELMGYFNTDQFIQKYRPIYLERNHAVPDTELASIAKELVDEGLIEDKRGIVYGMTVNRLPNGFKASYIFNTITLDYSLKTLSKSEIKAVLYGCVKYILDPSKAEAEYPFKIEIDDAIDDYISKHPEGIGKDFLLKIGLAE